MDRKSTCTKRPSLARGAGAVVFILLCCAIVACPELCQAFEADTLAAMSGERDGQRLGIAIGSTGDVNGDLFEDLLIGGLGGGQGGNAFLYFGGPEFDALPDISMKAAQLGDDFGYSVDGVYDVNGDGYPDWCVGAARAANDNGRVYVYFGSASPDTTPDLILRGEVGTVDMFGFSVSRAGDFNKDGYADLIVGALYNDAGGSNAGRAYIFFGRETPDAVPDVILTGQGQNHAFGLAVGHAGDLNGDGYGDVIVGAPEAANYEGRAYVFYGGQSVTGLPDAVLRGSRCEEEFGSSVNGAGDINGDDLDDLVVGAPFSLTESGRAYVYYGGSIENGPAYVLSSPETYDYFGIAVSSAGDINADGYDDLLIGADESRIGGPQNGRVYVFLSGPGSDGIADFVRQGNPGDRLGSAVSEARDFDGDGNLEFVVGAPRESSTGTFRGAAYVLTPLILTGVSESRNPGGLGILSIRPNPVIAPTSSVTVVVEATGSYWISLLDASGRIRRRVLNQLSGDGPHASQLHLDDFGSGIYFISAKDTRGFRLGGSMKLAVVK